MSSNCVIGDLSFTIIPNPNPIPRLCYYSTNKTTHFLFSNFNSKLKLTSPNKPLHHPLLASSSSSPSNQSSELENVQAKEAVINYLQQLGVSNEESVQIALNSPNYITMLVDSVNELDEFSLWNSDGADSENETRPVSFERKVYLMAKRKGDKGMIPFLESIGLSLSSATHLARYLASSITLPALITKVKYVKELFFANSDDGGHIAKKASQMMTHLSVSVDEDIQQTLSFFEKIQARRGGLCLLGSHDASFRYLIESFPQLLLLPMDGRMKKLMEFLDDVGVAEGCKRQIFLLFPPIFFYDIEKDIRPRLQALLEDGVEGRDFGQMLLKYPWILSRSIMQNYRNIRVFFDDAKVSKVSVVHAIKGCPFLLGLSVNKLKLVLEQFYNFGIRYQKLDKVIAKSPQLLLQKPHEFQQVVCFLRDQGLDDDIIGRILGRCPELFASSIEKTLKRKLNFLLGIGVSRSHLPRIIRKYPELFVCDIDRALLPRLTYLMHAGLSKRQVAIMVAKFSPILGYSIDEVLKPKLEFMTYTMEKPVSDLVEYPRYFSYSLEKKIKPRFWLLKDKNMECSLKNMLAKNDDEFSAEFGERQMLVPPL